MREGRARRRAVLMLGASAYALLFALGSQIDARGFTEPGETALRFALALPVALGVLALLLGRVFPALQAGRGGARRPFRAAPAFLLILVCYVPMFLIEYPGSFMYDTQRQVYQIAHGRYDAFHPLAHTLLIRLCLSAYGVLQSFEKCAALYSVIQMTLMAGCFALTCASIARSCSPRAARMSAAFFALYPAHMAFASNCTKDGLFAAFFALFLALGMEMALTGRRARRRAALLVLSGAMACLLRNNMVYALAVWAALLAVPAALRRPRFGRLLLCAVLAVALSRGANAALMAATHAEDGSVVEMLSVPIQQLARARLTAPECFTDGQKALMDEVFTDANYHTQARLYTRYEPTLADPVKNDLSEDVVRARFGELAAMWASVGARCPGVYLDAFLHLALPSLYPYRTYRVAQPYIETGLQPGVLTAPFGQEPMTQPRRFAAVRAWLDEHLFSTGADGVPVIRWLFNTGGVFWLLLALALRDAYDGCWRRAAVVALPVLLYGTYLLGPVMQGRYLYPFICSLPLFAARGAGGQLDQQYEGGFGNGV